MPITFDDIDINRISQEAAQETDEQLKNEISSLTRLTDANIAELFPQATDAKRMVELMRIVNSSQAETEKINQLVDNSQKFASTILKLLVKLA